MSAFRNGLISTLIVALLLHFGPRPEPVPPNSDDEIFGYRAVEKLAGPKGYYPLDQGPIGTCVAFGHKAAVDAVQATAVALGKEKVWKQVSPESIYGGSRNEARGRISGSMSDGSNGWAATKWLSRFGVTYMQPYPDYGLDLSTYSVSRAKQWGAYGNGGREDGRDIPGKFDSEAGKHPVQYTAKVTTLEEADAALKNGYHITICSNIGFSSPRDKDGFCQPRGSWNHCMEVSGKRNGGRKGYLVHNSWNRYIKGDGPNSTNKYKDQPDGSFYIEPAVLLRILRQGDSYAIGTQKGFERNILPDWMIEPDAVAPAELIAPDVAVIEPTPDPISTELADSQSDRNNRVYQGRDGSWYFREDDGRLLKFRNGSWWDCNAGGCRRVAQSETAYQTAA